MSLRPLLLSTACLALLAATGCRTLTGASCHRQQDYETAGNLAPLRVPAGLDAPDTSGALAIPELTAPEAPRDPEGPCIEAPPALTEPPPPPSEVVLPDPRTRDADRDGGDAEAADEEQEEPRRRRAPRRPR